MSVMMFYEVKTKKEISHDIFLSLIFTNWGYYNGFIIFTYVLEKNSIESSDVLYCNYASTTKVYLRSLLMA